MKAVWVSKPSSLCLCEAVIVAGIQAVCAKWAQTSSWLNDRKGWGARTHRGVSSMAHQRRVAVSCHPLVSLGRYCDFLCVCIMTDCTWLSLCGAVWTWPQTKCCIFLIRSFRQTVFFFFFFNSSSTMKAFIRGFRISLQPETALCFVGILVSELGLSRPEPVGQSHCADWHEDLKVPLVFSHTDPLLPDSLQIRAITLCSVCLYVCIYTPSSTTSLHGSPQEAFQGLTSFALITATRDWADRLIFPTLHEAAQQQQRRGTTRHPERFYN